MRFQTLAALLLLLAVPPATAAQDRCEVRREVDRQIDAAGLGGVLIAAEAGSLDVVGADVDRVRVRGVLCASDEGVAADARLVLERRRDAAWIEADLPSTRWRDYARMDLTVEMPRSLPADIRDGSGSIVVRDIAALRVDDGSGEMDIRDIEGAVIIDDGSGSMEIRDVTGDVRIEEDGSGNIVVVRVGGDFILENDGSGSVSYRDIEGRVSVPPDHR